MLPVNVDGGEGAVGGYLVVGQNSTFKVNANNTTTAVEQITARSLAYDITFTFNVTRATYDGQGAQPLAALYTSQVDQLAGDDHVIAVRGEEDQGNDGNLYNYLVVTVGTPDGERSSDVRIRMDHIGLPSAFQAVADAWTRLLALGPIAPAA